jgi:environmental stress-induced protein Ves
MRILRAADYKVMPWKNGAGSTTEIAVSPDGGALDDFDWRVSMARVAEDGAFSLFPEIDRTLLVLDGAGMVLTTTGHGSARLDSETAPYAFPGHRDTYATLIGGPIVDLNIMSRRERVRHRVKRIEIDALQKFSISSVTTMIFVEHGAISVHADDIAAELSGHDCIVLDSGDVVMIAPVTSARAVVIEFDT